MESGFKLRRKEVPSIISKSFSDLVTDAYSEEWQRLTEKNGVVISKKIVKGSPLVAMKGTGVVQAPPEDVFKVTGDIQKVMQWDRILIDAKEIRKIDETTSVIYLAFQGKFPVAPRDFSLLLSHKIDTDGSYIQVLRSVTDDNVPPISTFVRAELLTSGFIIKPYKVNGSKTLWSLVTYVVQFDPKGWLPTFIANKLVEYHPLSIARIRSFVTNKREADTPEIVFYKRTTIDEIKDDDSTLSIESDEIRNRTPSGSPKGYQSPQHSEDEDDNFVDASNDLTNLQVKNTGQFNDCLSAVQRELSYIQEILLKTQRKMRLLEQSQTAAAQSAHVSTLEYKSEFDTRINDLKKQYAEKLYQLQEQTKHYEILLKSKDDLLNNKIKVMSGRVTRMETSIFKLNFPFATWTGRFLLVFFLLFWPTVSSRVVKVLVKWFKETQKGRLLPVFVSLGGWLVFLKSLVAKSELHVKKLIRR